MMSSGLVLFSVLFAIKSASECRFIPANSIATNPCPNVTINSGLPTAVDKCKVYTDGTTGIPYAEMIKCTSYTECDNLYFYNSTVCTGNGGTSCPIMLGDNQPVFSSQCIGTTEIIYSVTDRNCAGSYDGKNDDDYLVWNNSTCVQPYNAKQTCQGIEPVVQVFVGAECTGESFKITNGSCYFDPNGKANDLFIVTDNPCSST